MNISPSKKEELNSLTLEMQIGQDVVAAGMSAAIL